jgi:hypothetical protein
MLAKPSSVTIIVHSAGFLLVFLFSLGLMAYNLFHTSANQRFSPKAFLKPATLISILRYRYNPHLSCQSPGPDQLPPWLKDRSYQLIAPVANSADLILAKEQNQLWTIVTADGQTQTLKTLITGIYFSGSHLVKSYAPVKREFVYPDCTNQACYLYTYKLDTQESSKKPAFAGVDKIPRPYIRDVFFDEARGLVSYGGSQDPNSERVVVNNREELIQTINETPSANRHLHFQYYLPGPGLLVYTDPVNHLTDFYLADGIGLFRASCPNLSALVN